MAATDVCGYSFPIGRRLLERDFRLIGLPLAGIGCWWRSGRLGSRLHRSGLHGSFRLAFAAWKQSVPTKAAAPAGIAGSGIKCSGFMKRGTNAARRDKEQQFIVGK